MKPTSIQPVKSEASLTARIRAQLRDAIVAGDLEPGTLYSVQTLAENFEVSRTPVREALIDLAGLDMVRFERNRGVRVVAPSPRDIVDIFNLRLLLEVPATRRAVQQIDDKAIAALRKELTAMEKAERVNDEPTLMRHDRAFHVIILDAAGNRRLSAHIDHLRDVVQTRGVSTVGRSRSLKDIISEHREVLACIERRDPDAAATAMRSHIEHTARLLVAQEGGDTLVSELWLA
jgi:DNA-binding GntR family transcriptional regulator